MVHSRRSVPLGFALRFARLLVVSGAIASLGCGGSRQTERQRVAHTRGDAVEEMSLPDWERVGPIDVWDMVDGQLRARPTAGYLDHALYRAEAERYEDAEVSVELITTDLDNFPQVWLRVLDEGPSRMTGYLFYVSERLGIGVIRHLNGTWEQTWSSPGGLSANRRYRLTVATQTEASAVALRLQLVDVESGATVFDQQWRDTAPSRLEGAGRVAISGYSQGEIRFGDFAISGEPEIGEPGTGDPADPPPGDGAPVIATVAPVGPLPAGTTRVVLSVDTDRDAGCRYAQGAGTPFEDMLPMDGAGRTHATTSSDLTDGTAHAFYVKCVDASGRESDEREILFTVGASVRIMPIGDSITQGNGAHDSYRRGLWRSLVRAGVAPDFVGTRRDHDGAPAPHPDFDLDHEGHWGQPTDYVKSVLDQIAWGVEVQPPDVALLHLGTNDLSRDQTIESTIADIREVIAVLREANPAVRVLIAQVIPSANPWFDAQLSRLNAALGDPDTGATRWSTATSPVVVVDQHTDFPLGELYDDYHPNSAGEARIAQRWFEALTGALP